MSANPLGDLDQIIASSSPLYVSKPDPQGTRLAIKTNRLLGLASISVGPGVYHPFESCVALQEPDRRKVAQLLVGDLAEPEITVETVKAGTDYGVVVNGTPLGGVHQNNDGTWAY